MKDYSKYIIKDHCTIFDALKQLNELSNDTLVVFIINDKSEMLGALTDGDIRRFLLLGGVLNDCVTKAMNTKFVYIFGEVDTFKIKKYKKQGIGLLPCLNIDKTIKKIYNLRIKKAIIPVDAVLMAGGKGERLRPLTEKTPKPLLLIDGKSIIDYNIDSLISYGVEHISITVNYLKEQIEEHFSEKRNNIKISCVREPKYLGTMGSIKFVENFHNNTILIMNSDLFTNIDYESFYLHFKLHNADMSVAAIPYGISVPYGIFDLDGRYIKGIKEKPTYNYYANAGIYLIKKSVLNLIPNGDFFNATDLIDKMIQQNGKVIRFPMSGYWIDIGKHDDFRKAQDFAKHINSL